MRNMSERDRHKNARRGGTRREAARDSRGEGEEQFDVVGDDWRAADPSDAS